MRRSFLRSIARQAATFFMATEPSIDPSSAAQTILAQVTMRLEIIDRLRTDATSPDILDYLEMEERVCIDFLMRVGTNAPGSPDNVLREAVTMMRARHDGMTELLRNGHVSDILSHVVGDVARLDNCLKDDALPRGLAQVVADRSVLHAIAQYLPVAT